MAHEAENIENPSPEGGEVDDEEGGELCADCGSADGRNAVSGPEEAINSIRLPPDLGGDPAREQCDETQRTHQQLDSM
jgi:hypothetical protein